MEILRTPDERFADVPDFPYEPKYVEVDGLRIAYVEAGPADGEPVVLVHGEPTWSFLYRVQIARLANAGYRAIAPDLIGFGRSDKLASRDEYTYARHVEWVRDFVFDQLGLSDITYVGHDWGGLIGLRLAAEHTDGFARFVATNTGLPTGDQPMPDVWLRFRDVVRTSPEMSVSRLVASGCQRPLAPEIAAAYEAPFPDQSYQAAVRAFPDLVPAEPDNPASQDNRAAWAKLAEWDKPFLAVFNSDPVTGGMGPILKKKIPGAASVTHPTIEGYGHFIQEDSGDELADAIIEFLS
jgi:haloalkane dehalogenase